MSSEEYDAIVIGAGISGLTAANTLKKKHPSLRVLVLEAKDRVGGRTCGIRLKTESGSDVWDLGGQWVSRCQRHIMALVSELGLETYQQYSEGSKFVQMEDHSIRAYTTFLPSLSWIQLADLRRFMSKIDAMRRQVPTEDPFSCSKARVWDAMTLETFKQKTVWTAATVDIIDAAVRSFLGVEPSQVSLLFFLMYVNAAGGLVNIVHSTANTARELKIKGGTHQICEKLAEVLGDIIRLNQPVTTIKQDNSAGGSEVVITTTNGNSYRCKRAIITVPLNLLGKIKFEPSLPIFKRDYIRRAPLGNKIKVVFTFKEAFWRDRGFSGEILSSGGPSTVARCDSGPLCLACDATSADGNPALVAFIAGHQAVQWGQLQREDRKRGVLESLARFFGPDVFTYLDYGEKDWNQEPYSEGGDVCVAHPGAMMYYSKALRQTFGKIHFAGAETATVWTGYMDGAVQSGLRAAIEVLRIIKPDVVTAEDLALLTSLEAPQEKSIRRKRTESSWVTWTVGVGSLLAVLFAVSKTAIIQTALRDCATKRVTV